MRTKLVSDWRLREAARCIAQGGIIAYPTEAVYGLGCDPMNWFAVERILALKSRPVEMGLILIAADFQQLIPYVVPLADNKMQQLYASWPGPNTWLLPANPDCPPWLQGQHETLAVRVTAHPLAAALCRAYNSPLVSTSANQSGQPPARSALQVRTRLPGGVDLILAGEVGLKRSSSTIRDAITGRTIRP
jgi:L-threonylcarbamoyladenylate synthase